MAAAFNFEIAEQVLLTVAAEDAALLRQVSQLTGLGEGESCGRVQQEVEGVLQLGNPAERHRLTRRQFDGAVRRLLPPLEDEEKRLVEVFLGNLFYAYDRESRETVPTSELLVGLTLLSGGSKTSKLAFAFSLFDEQGQDAIEQVALARMFSALLTALFACTTGDVFEQSVADAVHKCAVRTALSIYMELDLMDHELLDFDSFGAWYNSSGYEAAPWLELLDTTKWPTSTNDSESASHLDSQAMISFDFPPPFAVKVTITEGDVGALGKLVESTCMHFKSPSEVATLFQQHAQEGLLQRQGFDACMRRLVPPKDVAQRLGMDISEAAALSEVFSSFFVAFERHEGWGVDVMELAVGFSLLCAGNKSDKLSHAWELISTDATTGSLTRRGLWRFLRSFLKMIMAVSSTVLELTAEQLASTADSGAVWTAALVFDEAERAEKNSITFDEFAEWYTVGGYKVASWFELLDLSKWVLSQDRGSLDSEPAGAQVHPYTDGEVNGQPHLNGVSGDVDGGVWGSEEAAAVHEEDEDEKDEELEDGWGAGGWQEEEEAGISNLPKDVAFTFQLTEDGQYLMVKRDDAEFVLRMASLSSSGTLTCDALYDALLAESTPNEDAGVHALDKAGYDRAIRAMFPDIGSLASGEEIKFLTFGFSNVYYALEIEDRALTHEVACALSMFFAGSKSQKLQFGFTLFDSDEDNCLSEAELQQFLGAILAALSACTFQSAQRSADKTTALVQHASSTLARDVVDMYAHPDRRTTFEEFGQWYNVTGFQIAPWLELLDLSKWNMGSWAAVHMGGEEADGPGNPTRAGDASDTRYSFILMDSTGEPSPFTLSITDADVASIRSLVTKTGLFDQAPSAVSGPLLEAAPDGILSKSAFDRCVRRLIPSSSLLKDEQNAFTVLLSSIFYNFEAGDEEQGADALELAVGMAVLCNGDKSSKLRYGWHILDQDHDGCLDQAELMFFLRSFLRMLIALSFQSIDLELLEAKQHATGMASWLSRVIVDTFSRAGDDLVTFDDFAEWYLEGHQVAPWLELLDLSKWVLPK